MGFIIAIISICLGASIPLTAIITNYKQKKLKLQIQMLEKETELERLRLDTYTAETEKMKFELEQSKQILLESKQDLNFV